MNDRTMHTLPGPFRFPTTRWTLVMAAGDLQASQEVSANSFAKKSRILWPIQQKVESELRFLAAVLTGN